jgi:tetratricopeptide (TPR) repeat protein
MHITSNDIDSVTNIININLGSLDDIPDELANTIINIFLRYDSIFSKNGYILSNKKSPAINYPPKDQLLSFADNYSKAKSEFKSIIDFIQQIRTFDKFKEPDHIIYDIACEFALDVFKYNIKNAGTKLPIRRKIERKFKTVNEISNLVEIFRGTKILPLHKESYPHMLTGLENIYNGQFNQAINYMNKAIQISPNSAYCYTIRGYAYEYTGQYDLSIADYNNSIKINPFLLITYFYRANIFTCVNCKHFDYSKAIRDFTKIIEVNDQHTDAYFNRAIAYSSIKKYEKAIIDYSKLIEIEPAYLSYSSYNNRGWCYYRIGEDDEAWTDFEKYCQATGISIDDFKITRKALFKVR